MPRKYSRVDLFHIPSTNERIEKFINFLMKDGKKNVARRIFADTLEEIKNSGHTNPQLVRETALENASPNIMVKSRRIG
jgi:small subunit ribosomal protein S7